MPTAALPPSPSLHQLQEALARVRSVLPVTPLSQSVALGELCGSELFIKWDNKFRTGSFKERGAVNVLEGLSATERKIGVCAASAGNHALALSFHAQRLGVPCVIVMPVHAPLVKVQATRRTGARVIMQGNNLDESYEHAVKLSQSEGLQFVSPFDDERVIAGQSTCGHEIAEQLADVQRVVVPVGGGGLIAGIALALRHQGSKARIIGVQSDWVVQGRAGHHGAAMLAPMTIADGIAVKRIGTVTAPLVAALVDELVTITDEQVAEGITRLLEHERTVVEGAGAAAVAALLAGLVPRTGEKTVALVCGSNIDMNVLSRLIDRDIGQHNRLLRITISVPDRPGSLAAITRMFADARANVLEVLHNRTFSRTPGSVEIGFLLEVRDPEHSAAIVEQLRAAGLPFFT